MLYQLTHIKHYYENKIVLDFNSLQISQGEIIGISGKNGSGKSTLLRLLAFLESPTFGEVKYFGTSRTQIAILLPEIQLLSRSVRANLEYILQIRHQPPNPQKIADVLKLAGLEPKTFLERKHYELSSGEKQRVGLAQRLLLEPKVLLLDEPTNSLDHLGLKTLSEAIQWCHQEYNTTIITISHDKKWLEKNSQKLLKLHFGELINQKEANLLSHNWSKNQNGEKYYDFGNGAILELPQSKEIDLREGIFIHQDHILLHCDQHPSFEAVIIGIRTLANRTDEVLLEIALGKEVLKKYIPKEQIPHFQILQTIAISFDTTQIAQANQK
ncbi:hypothetical protein BBW65_02825 [Helicobacter enhydrae]|uniref:ABC transporter domain-containing protein n=1 Tax=Helicobacter enhydrae TaxID=222136 RepID=A0A1B1U4Z2_9HELI|nr:energy-coupling factor ABC transporter ATP-binding protein [Helicobacter enhydrae]ANV97801.1 hypothetical protein BBW65_02825 [Helicobacter enhydrae]